MIVQIFDSIMQRLRRKYAFVDSYGDIRFFRYYVFYVEKNVDNSFAAKYLPNIFVHFFPGEPSGEGPDGDQPHYHPWTTISFIFKGGYASVVNGIKRLKLTAPAITFQSYKDSHQIDRMTPGTWTLFCHGIRRQDWLVNAEKCAKICDSCERLNEGHCMKSGRIRPMTPETELAFSAAEAKGWRKAKWICVDEDFDKLIADRKEKLKRIKVETPDSSEKKFIILKEITIMERRASSVEK